MGHFGCDRGSEGLSRATARVVDQRGRQFSASVTSGRSRQPIRPPFVPGSTEMVDSPAGFSFSRAGNSQHCICLAANRRTMVAAANGFARWVLPRTCSRLQAITALPSIFTSGLIDAVASAHANARMLSDGAGNGGRSILGGSSRRAMGSQSVPPVRATLSRRQKRSRSLSRERASLLPARRAWRQPFLTPHSSPSRIDILNLGKKGHECG
jgi:hypothetical protein